jgi:hypothetical protein
MSLTARVGVGLLSAGWVGPLVLAASILRTWLERELLVRLANGTPHDSLPYLAFATSLLQASLVWLGAVIVAWTAIYLREPASSSSR